MSGRVNFVKNHLAKELQLMKDQGTYKAERIISSPQAA